MTQPEKQLLLQPGVSVIPHLPELKPAEMLQGPGISADTNSCITSSKEPKAPQELHIVAALKDPLARRNSVRRIIGEAASSGRCDSLVAAINFAQGQDLRRSEGDLLELVIEQIVEIGIPTLAEKQRNDAVKTIALVAFAATNSLSATFKQTDVRYRLALGKALGRVQAFLDSAACLSSVPLENPGLRKDGGHLSLCLDVAEAYLKGGNAGAAEEYVTRGGFLVSDCQDTEILLRLRVLQAQMLEIRHKWLEAASRLYELSQDAQNGRGLQDTHQAADGERPQERSNLYPSQRALVCCILAPPSFQQKRLQDKILQDSSLNGTRWPAVAKMLGKGQPIPPIDAEAIITLISADGVSAHAINKAIFAKNLRCLQELYSSIKLSKVSELLNLPETKVELAAAELLRTGVLHGRIDCDARFLLFSTGETVLWETSRSAQALKLSRDLQKLSAALEGGLM